MQYVICQIGARQYLVKPGQIIEVDKLSGEPKTLSVDKVMLLVEDGKVEIGKPFLKKVLDFEVLENIKKPKIRVATYKAKANYRRVKGSRREVSRIKLAEEKAVKKV
ncbi:MAG: 50S ribosomal protein L21 [Patescibacteria group bacterium]|nr:50S ribosomal protein L21 [Patescibacteria group bacterium]